MPSPNVVIVETNMMEQQEDVTVMGSNNVTMVAHAPGGTQGDFSITPTLFLGRRGEKRIKKKNDCIKCQL